MGCSSRLRRGALSRRTSRENGRSCFHVGHKLYLGDHCCEELIYVECVECGEYIYDCAYYVGFISEITKKSIRRPVFPQFVAQMMGVCYAYMDSSEYEMFFKGKIDYGTYYAKRYPCFFNYYDVIQFPTLVQTFESEQDKFNFVTEFRTLFLRRLTSCWNRWTNYTRRYNMGNYILLMCHINLPDLGGFYFSGRNHHSNFPIWGRQIRVRFECERSNKDLGKMIAIITA